MHFSAGREPGEQGRIWEAASARLALSWMLRSKTVHAAFWFSYGNEGLPLDLPCHLRQNLQWVGKTCSGNHGSRYFLLTMLSLSPVVSLCAPFPFVSFLASKPIICVNLQISLWSILLLSACGVLSLLVLQTQGEMVAGKEMSVTVEFTNPLKQTLENVILYLEGPGVLRTMKKEFR